MTVYVKYLCYNRCVSRKLRSGGWQQADTGGIDLSGTVKTILRLAGLGLIIFGLAADLPSGWSIASVAAGFLGLIAGGGGG